MNTVENNGHSIADVDTNEIRTMKINPSGVIATLTDTCEVDNRTQDKRLSHNSETVPKRSIESSHISSYVESSVLCSRCRQLCAEDSSGVNNSLQLTVENLPLLQVTPTATDTQSNHSNDSTSAESELESDEESGHMEHQKNMQTAQDILSRKRSRKVVCVPSLDARKRAKLQLLQERKFPVPSTNESLSKARKSDSQSVRKVFKVPIGCVSKVQLIMPTSVGKNRQVDPAMSVPSVDINNSGERGQVAALDNPSSLPSSSSTSTPCDAAVATSVFTSSAKNTDLITTSTLLPTLLPESQSTIAARAEGVPPASQPGFGLLQAQRSASDALPRVPDRFISLQDLEKNRVKESGNDLNSKP